MSLTKRTYVDGETIITADNLNDIQDEIIANGVSISSLQGLSVYARGYLNTTFDAATDVGLYQISTSYNLDTIPLNASRPATLMVLSGSPADRFRAQLLYSGSDCLLRFKIADNWTDWINLFGTNGYIGSTSGTDINDANDLVNGNYYIATSRAAGENAIQNLPIAKAGVMCDFFARRAGNYNGKCQMYITDNGVYLRTKMTSSAADWDTWRVLQTARFLTNADDFNTVGPGTFYRSSSLSQVANEPVHRLGVLLSYVVGSQKVQLYISSGALFYRRGGTSSWGRWFSIGYHGNVGTGAGTDFNDFVQFGTYYIPARHQCDNAPTSENGYLEVTGMTPGIINEEGSVSPDGSAVLQRYTTMSRAVYIRERKQSSGWNAWRQISSTFGYIRDNPVSWTLEENFARMNEPWTPVTTGMKRASSKAGITEWPEFTEGVEYRGLPYSGAYNTEGDILINRNISTFYSAVLNPESVLYTRQAGEPGASSGLRATYYGTVCSSFASRMIGSTVYRTTKNLSLYCDKVDVHSFDDIKPGQLILALNEAGSNHTQVVKAIGYSPDHEPVVEVVESVVPTIRTRSYLWRELLALLNSEGTVTYGVYEYPDAVFDTIELLPYATDVISEFGNNTWYRRGDTINIYVNANVNEIYVAKAVDTSLEWTAISSDVAQGEVVDITDYITSTGKWYVTTDKSSDLYAELIVAYPGVWNTQSGETSNSVKVVCTTSPSECTAVGYQVYYGDPANSSYHYVEVEGELKPNCGDFVADQDVVVPDEPWTIRLYMKTDFGQFYYDIVNGWTP